MGKYVEKHLHDDEIVVDRVKLSKWKLLGKWIVGILFCWLLFIPLFSAIKATVIFTHRECVLTNKRVVAKKGVFNIATYDVPLDKIIDVGVAIKFWGRVFNVHNIRITSEQGDITIKGVSNALSFKNALMAQIEQQQENRLARQASWTAQALLQNPEMLAKITKK